MGEGAELRGDMVEAARRFMSTPKVRETPFAEQKQFLLVTEAEIEEARKTLPAAPPPEASTAATAQTTVYAAPPEPTSSQKMLNFAQSLLVLGGISYTSYRFIRGWLLPRYFDVPDPAQEERRQFQQQMNELQNSLKFVMDSVSQTSQQLAQQQEQVSRALMSSTSRSEDLAQLVAGINTVKALLLSQTQFAPIQTPAANHLPAWQRNNEQAENSSLPAWQKPKESHVDKVKSAEVTSDDGFQTPPPGDAEDATIEDEDEDELTQPNGIPA